MLSRRTLLQGVIVTPLLSHQISVAKWLVEQDMPYAVQEIYPALHRSKLVVAGGLYASRTGRLEVTDQVIAYDLVTEQWQLLPSLPEPRHHPMLCSVNNQLYAFSGFIANEKGIWVASPDVLLLDEANQQWRRLNMAKMPFPMCETVSMVRGHEVHLATGRKPNTAANGQWRNHLDINYHLIFDTRSNLWRQGKPAPTGRNSAAAAVVDDQWYVIGGRTVDEGNKAHTEVYDSSTGNWSSRQPMPQAQGGLAAAALGKYIYVFGGEYFTDGGGVYQEVWQYDTDRDHWQQVDIMPVPRHGLGAVTFNQKIYVVGGATMAGGKATSARLSVFTGPPER